MRLLYSPLKIMLPLATHCVSIWCTTCVHAPRKNQDYLIGTPRRGVDHTTPLLAPIVGVSGCYSVKIDGPTSISRHNPQPFHGWTPGWKRWRDWGMRGGTNSLSPHPYYNLRWTLWWVMSIHLFDGRLSIELVGAN